MDSAEKGNTSSCFFMSKAFDTLDHDLLISKLKYFGKEGTARKWIESALTNIFQIIERKDSKERMENKIRSEPVKAKSGIPRY